MSCDHRALTDTSYQGVIKGVVLIIAAAIYTVGKRVGRA
jgi:hypothetical protein